MKKVLSLLLTGALVFSLSGCLGKSESRITPEDVKNRVIGEAEEYLKENYPDDTFTYVSGRSPNWAYQYYELAFSSKEYDNQKITVFAEPDEKLKNDDGLTVYHYCDNYFQYYMKDDAEEYFYNIAKEHLGEEIVVKVRFSNGLVNAENVSSDNFNINFNENNLRCLVYFFDNKPFSEINSDFEALVNKIASYNVTVKFYYIYTEELEEIFNNNTIAFFDDYEQYSIDNDVAPKYNTHNKTVTKY
ncbi:MAG: hypothetical protein UH080_03920 [Ruminococcus sp.]|nr:hypothetical protein [Ruminococcus sp.]